MPTPPNLPSGPDNPPPPADASPLRSAPSAPPAAVFFDAVHTLFDLQPDYAGAFARVARDFGYEVETSRVETALVPLLEDLDRRKRSDVSHACTPESLEQEWIEFNKVLFRAVGIEGDVHALSLELERRFDSGLYAAVYPEVEAILGRVRALGFSMGIISNGTAGMENCLRVLGLTDRVDTVLVSALVGHEKPAVEIFRRAEELVGLPAEQCLLVGDNYWADIVGAQRAGWGAIWLNRKGKPAPEPCVEVTSLSEVPELALKVFGRTATGGTK